MFGVDDIVGAVMPVFGKIIDRAWPDPAEAAKAQMALLQLQQSGDLARLVADTDLAKGQMAVNQAEAGNPSLFVSGWRPAVGWMCAAGVGTQFLLGPVATFGVALLGKTVVFPTLDTGTLLPLLLGMLGLGGMRTFEKIKGVTK